MIEEQAIVLSSADGIAQVETRRDATCGGCSAQAGCGTVILSRIFGSRRTRFRVLNPVDAGPGDRVIVGFEEKMLVKASLMLYMVPLLSLILGGVAGQFGAEGVSLLSPEQGSILGGISGLLGGLYWVRLRTRHVGTHRRYTPVILRSVTKAFVEQPR